MRRYMTTTNFFARLGFILFMMGLGVLWSHNAHAQDDATPEPMPTSSIMLDEEGNPVSCGECHIDIVASWQTSSHATTYISEDFQLAWQNADDDAPCLECHTTGFSAVTGEFTHEGVACEACHGDTPVNHPDEPITVEPGLNICTDCHLTTHQEWLSSAHGEQQLACTVCHNPHPQQVRFESNTGLCLNCHAENYQPEQYSHATHTDQACTDCHWHRSDMDTTLHLTTGELPPTGHDARVETRACNDCHGQLAAGEIEVADVSAGTEEIHAALNTQVRIQELEAEVAEVRAQGENSSAVHLIQGLLVGGAFGMVITLVVSRIQGRRMNEEDDHA